MTCQELVELVTAYLDGTLSAQERQEFDEHLALCPGCDRYLEQLRVTIALLGELPEDSLSGPVRAELLEAFAARRPATGQEQP
jgi:anti-sigma factor RsiW